jgi:hypothetical protein
MRPARLSLGLLAAEIGRQEQLDQIGEELRSRTPSPASTRLTTSAPFPRSSRSGRPATAPVRRRAGAFPRSARSMASAPSFSSCCCRRPNDASDDRLLESAGKATCSGALPPALSQRWNHRLDRRLIAGQNPRAGGLGLDQHHPRSKRFGGDQVDERPQRHRGLRRPGRSRRHLGEDLLLTLVEDLIADAEKTVLLAVEQGVEGADCDLRRGHNVVDRGRPIAAFREDLDRGIEEPADDPRGLLSGASHGCPAEVKGARAAKPRAEGYQPRVARSSQGKAARHPNESNARAALSVGLSRRGRA